MAVANEESYNQQIIAEFRARGGVVTGALADTRMLLLHHVGARSGIERVTPLVWWPAGEAAVAVLASNYGAPRHPAWYQNLLANPKTIAEIGAATWTVHARVAVANERRVLLDGIMAANPSAAAAVRNAQREIPVVVVDLLDTLDASFEAKAGSLRSASGRSRPVMDDQ
ncbi:MAG TPA: nitroreductase family deazaflavin-dependent oxidoreductase [Acidimicrobiales bacterium]|jgi:deazaflavin-dependent oxidoreductase (nitroreductase family)|nr:nitroreductase family deazaflavin-dependent oxidoreductase [Acidimicrobiales bacterium]